MIRSLVLLIGLVAVLAGCGGEEAREAEPVDVEAATGSLGRGSPPSTAVTRLSSRPSGRLAPLTLPQRRQLQAIATSIDRAVDQFDATIRACNHWASCVDAAWAIVVADLDWPPYYLQRIGARGRGCEPLGYAATGIYGFNLGVRQLDYAAPAEDGMSTRSDYLALVDGLRPVPSELRSAAASGCR
jgi:hypothetical protein